MKLNNYIIGIPIIFIITLTIHFWVGHYYKNNKFKTFLTLVTTITSILFSSAIVIQVFNYNHQRSSEEIQKYSDLSKIFLDDTINIFIENPEMNYYYEDLLGIKMIDQNTKRNIILENQISMLIFSRLAKFAIFIQQEDDPDITKKIDDWLGHIAATFMKSDTLKSYWINEYKPKLSGPASRQYMKKNFNL